MSTDTDPNRQTSMDRIRELDSLFEEQLEKYSGKSRKRKSSGKAGKFSLKRWGGYLILSLLGLVLPFLVLIRTSVFMYSSYSLNGWLALAIGVSVTIALLLLYGVYLSFRWNGSMKVNRYVVRGVIGLVLAYCCYGLIYLSSLNVKNSEIRFYYRSLHPVLRVSIATVTLADPGLIITDMQRTPEDYISMQLTPREQSLHYEQPTGYVHAVDLRTIGRPAWKNVLTRYTFELFGFTTLRHVGTADHLHVALPLND